jgi:cytochrome c peroxidase
MRRRWLTALVPLLLAGCQPAVKYGGKPAPAADKPTPSAAAATDDPLDWLDAHRAPLDDIPIVFVHEADGDEWAKLPGYWNTPEAQAAALIGLGPGLAPPVADVKPAVKVKVPAGLDDPRSAAASFAADPPTRRKWELGRDLFFDKSWLTDKGDLSCASCHRPESGFADGVPGHGDRHDPVNTPTLVNGLYNPRQFWDGRVGALEEVVQRTPADETTPPAGKEFRHVWPGVIGRLRDPDYHFKQKFLNAFGAAPTQDSLGRALAAYLRTLLAGDSLYDRALGAAEAEAKAKNKPAELAAAHFEKFLDDAALQALGREKADKAAVAAELLHGYRLFMNQDEKVQPTNCAACHHGREFTDGGFHNVGVGWRDPDPARYPGHFPYAPLGQKSRTLVGAYKTPTLRGLLRTGPYFHDGSQETLEDAVRFHTQGWKNNDFIDPQLQPLLLKPDELNALVLFLKALNGDPVDASVARPPPSD